MSEWLLGHLPSALSGWEVTLLLATSVFTAFLTASVGVGGGVFLLAVLSLVMPVAAIIPVHGLVQFGANANRALMLWRDINWRSTLWFLPGALLGWRRCFWCSCRCRCCSWRLPASSSTCAGGRVCRP